MTKQNFKVPKVINELNFCRVLSEVDNCQNCLICGTEYCNDGSLVNLSDITRTSVNKFEYKIGEDSNEYPEEIVVNNPYVKTNPTPSTTRQTVKTINEVSTKMPTDEVLRSKSDAAKIDEISSTKKSETTQSVQQVIKKKKRICPWKNSSKRNLTSRGFSIYIKII
uniref:Uncharacterized protein n=1 Tax=Meloidogyne enterolobii TaxID=390850 RepID=A0A6V7W5X4_MELEN|nr:unnamed protein product [Meloidogyne enterolobii]